MDPLAILSKAGSLMLAHPELVADIVEMIDMGADPETIKKAVRDLKVDLADKIAKGLVGL